MVTDLLPPKVRLTSVPATISLLAPAVAAWAISAALMVTGPWLNSFENFTLTSLPLMDVWTI